MTQPASAGPLDGIRVTDFTNVMSGPVCTRLLADMGAEVIKVEPPQGDHSRTRHPIRNGVSIHFGHLNAGKKSIALDLKSPAGKKAALELCKQSDIVVENWRPGVAARLGLDFESLKKVKPGIIYCAVSGYGQKGPNAKLPGLASLVEARSGFAAAQMKLDGTDKPMTSGLMLGDSLSGIWAYAGVMTALAQRGITGKGSMVDLSMHDSMLFSLIYEFHEAQFGKSIRRSHIPLRTADGYMQVPPVTERNFIDVANAIGKPEWINGEKFGSVNSRNENWFELLDAIQEWTSKRSTAECEKVLMAAGVPCASYRTVDDVLKDPHEIERGSIGAISYGSGKYQLPNAPFQLPGFTTHVRDRIANFDEDLESVLGGILGYSKEEIEACRVSPEHAHE